MTNLARIPVVWNGLPGLPGVSVFYSDETDVVSTVVALKAFFTALASSFPPPLTWNFPSSGDVILDTSGQLVGAWSGGAGGTVVATGNTSQYAAGVGFRARWDTGKIVGGRRLRGSTFLVPLLSAGYDSSGTIVDATVTIAQTAANTLVTNGTTYVWHRPAPGTNTGVSWPVVSASVPDKVATLRSRRT